MPRSIENDAEVLAIHHSRRRGLSLIEVIIAMGILVGTTAILAQLISIGEKQASKAVKMTEAQTICHNKMAELMSGLSPLTAIKDEPVAIGSPWNYSVKIEPVGFRDLFSLTVIVASQRSALASPTEDLNSAGPVCHLTRWASVSDFPEGTEFNFETMASESDDEASLPRTTTLHPDRGN